MGYRRDDPLRDCEELPLSARIPAPLSSRLDALVRLAEAAGENTSRKEVLAALVLAAPTAEGELGEALREYRTARVGDAMIEGQEETLFLEPARHQPGPRRRASTRRA